MRQYFFTLLPACVLLCVCIQISGQATSPAKPEPESEIDDPAVILELGTATSWNFNGGAVTFAPDLAVEVTPIENWLELEAGVSPFFTRNATEWDTDFLIKKPWTLSRKAEFMIGVGPQWAHTTQDKRASSDTFSVEVAGDFMFWPAKRHRFGWFLEPAYDYSCTGGHPQSIGMSAGLLIGIH